MPVNVSRPVELPFPDRAAAGQALVRLHDLGESVDPLMLATSTGGLSVARELAVALDASLDLLPVVKVRMQGKAQLTLGAAVSSDLVYWHEDIRRRFAPDPVQYEAAMNVSCRELEYQQTAYRGNRSLPQIRGRWVILVDDGIMTGATMLAAIKAVRIRQPARVLAAVPVVNPESVAKVSDNLDEFFYLAAPEPLHAVADWYIDNDPLIDSAVQSLLGPHMASQSLARTG